MEFMADQTEHEKINFISPRAHVLFSLYTHSNTDMIPGFPAENCVPLF